MYCSTKDKRGGASETAPKKRGDSLQKQGRRESPRNEMSTTGTEGSRGKRSEYTFRRKKEMKKE